jgi:hypothetical protein
MSMQPSPATCRPPFSASSGCLYLIHMTAQGSRSAIREKRSDEVAADEDRRIMAAVARHVLSVVDGIKTGSRVGVGSNLPLPCIQRDAFLAPKSQREARSKRGKA